MPALLHAHAPVTRGEWNEEDHPRGPAGSSALTKFDPDQPRDEQGRWSETGGGGGLPPADTPLPSSFSEPRQRLDLNDVERGAISNYSADGYDDLNTALRGGASLSPKQARQVEALDRVTDHAFSEPVTAYRGAWLHRDWMGSHLQDGVVWEWPAFSSTTLNKDVAAEHLLGSATLDNEPNMANVLFRVRDIRRGAFIKDFSDLPEEFEVLLPRNLRVRIDRVDGQKVVGKKNRVATLVDVSVL